MPRPQSPLDGQTLPLLRARYERQRRDWTLKQTAFFSTLTTAEISLIETGRLIPTEAQLAKLAQAFRIQPPASLLKPVAVVEAEEGPTEPHVVAER